MPRLNKKTLIVSGIILLISAILINAWTISQSSQPLHTPEMPIRDIAVTLFEQKQTSVTAPEISTHPSAITITRRPNRQTKAQSTDETTEELHQKKTLSASKETAHSLASEISEFVPGPGITKSNNRPTENEVQEMIKSGVVVW